MVSLLSSPAMPSIQHYCLLFYLYRDIRVLHSRGLIDHIRILLFQMHFSSFLGSGGYFGIIISQVPSWRCLAQKMLFKCSILQDTAIRASPAWQSLQIHIDAELQSHLWLVPPTDFHLCESYSSHWSQVGAGHSVAHWCELALCAPVLFTPVLLLSLGLLFHACNTFITMGTHIMCLSRSEHHGVLLPVAL